MTNIEAAAEELIADIAEHSMNCQLNNRKFQCEQVEYIVRDHAERWNLADPPQSATAANVTGSELNARYKPKRVPYPGEKCNRSVCDERGVDWWNPSTQAFYCQPCAAAINKHSRGLCIPRSEWEAAAANVSDEATKREGRPLTISDELPDILFRKVKPSLTQEQALSAAELVRHWRTPASDERLREERDHWKANHDEMVARNQLLRERTDLTAEQVAQRLGYIDQLTTANAQVEKLQARVQQLESELAELKSYQFDLCKDYLKRADAIVRDSEQAALDIQQRAESAEARVAELEGERLKVEQAVAVLADHGRWNWTQAISRRDAANEVLALMVNAGLIEGRQHPSVWGGTGFSVYRVNGRLYGRTDGVDDSLFVPAAAEDRA